MMYIDKSKRESVIAYYRKAIEVDKNCAEAYYTLASKYNEDVINNSKKAYALDNTNHEALYDIAFKYHRDKNYKDALDYYLKYLKVEPEDKYGNIYLKEVCAELSENTHSLKEKLSLKLKCF